MRHWHSSHRLDEFLLILLSRTRIECFSYSAHQRERALLRERRWIVPRERDSERGRARQLSASVRVSERGATKAATAMVICSGGLSHERKNNNKKLLKSIVNSGNVSLIYAPYTLTHTHTHTHSRKKIDWFFLIYESSCCCCLLLLVAGIADQCADQAFAAGTGWSISELAICLRFVCPTSLHILQGGALNCGSVGEVREGGVGIRSIWL